MSEKKDCPPKNIPSVQVKYPAFASDLLTHDFIDEVVRVYNRMLDRLYYGAHKRRGWATSEPWKELSEHECRTCIRDSLAKGNLIDAMNYLMFAHLNGHKLPTLCAPYSVDSQMRDQLAKAMGVTGRSWDEILAMVSAEKSHTFQKDKQIAAIARELKLDPEASEESILSTIHMLVTTRQAELKSSDFGFMRPDGEMVYGMVGRTLVVNGTAVKNLAPGQPVTPAPININITGCMDPDTLERLAHEIKANRPNADAGSIIHTKNTVSIKNEAAPDLSFKIKAGAKWPHMTPPAGAVEERILPRTTQPEGKDKTRKTALPNAIAAPYGVKTSKQRQYELTMEADDSGIPSPLFIFRSKKDRDDYLPLLRTFLGALEQAAYGKGRERHANDLPFIEQPILTMAHMLDSDAGLAQQVIKKTIEARSLPTKQARINELRGTLVYAAAMILFEEMYGRADDPDNLNGAL